MSKNSNGDLTSIRHRKITLRIRGCCRDQGRGETLKIICRFGIFFDFFHHLNSGRFHIINRALHSRLCGLRVSIGLIARNLSFGIILNSPITTHTINHLVCLPLKVVELLLRLNIVRIVLDDIRHLSTIYGGDFLLVHPFLLVNIQLFIL